MADLIPHPTERPPSGIMRRCRVVEVVDGDTVTVEIVTKARVRLLDCWAPEKRSNNSRQKGIAIESEDNLKDLALNRDAEIFIPLDQAARLDDTLSFGRVLGAVYVDDREQSLSQQQVTAGMASSTKGGKLGE